MKRVLILAGHDLFGGGVEALLRQTEGVQVVGLVKDYDIAIGQIRGLRPDVVVVDTNDSAATCGAVISQVIGEGLAMHVVGLKLGDNQAFDCSVRQFVIKDEKDLITTFGI